MAIYEYRCETCEYYFTERHSIGEGDSATCPNCDKPAIKVILSTPGIVFKGSGFYSTDKKQPKVSSDGRMDKVWEAGQDQSDF